MKLRKLEQKDAPFMLEWMHDLSVVEDLQANFNEKTIEDCIAFIEDAQDIEKNLHLAIVDENDTYMGTVSLKHIKGDEAEFAITVRRVAMGQGYSRYGMDEIIRIGLEELKMKKIFWCVSPENKRAVRFYDKNGCKRVVINEGTVKEGYTLEQIEKYIWYEVLSESV